MIEMAGLTKLIVCIFALIASTTLGIYKVIDGQATTGIITAVLGYVFGNGHGIISARKQGLK